MIQMSNINMLFSWNFVSFNSCRLYVHMYVCVYI